MGGRKVIRQKAHRRFDELLEDNGEYTVTLEYGDGQKYAVFSDLHMGDGTYGDNFKQNEATFKKALEYYREKEYTVILLGDIEEFHQFTLDKIRQRYQEIGNNKSIYNKLREFLQNNRLYRVFGNHDIEWAIYDPLAKEKQKAAPEAIKLKKGEEVHIMLTHGHQAEEYYEKDLHTVRFGTTFYKLLEGLLRIESKSLLSEMPNYKDKIYSQWTKKSKKILICGHTHCPIIGSRFIDYNWIKKQHRECKRQLKKQVDMEEKKHWEKRKEWLNSKLVDIENKRQKGFRFPKSPSVSLSNHYFNTGGGLFKDAITNLEIDGDLIRLRHWNNSEEKSMVFMELELNISALVAEGP
jgi:UDP-2,3-diacylglucosamine pyrophosphatase LpxH